MRPAEADVYPRLRFSDGWTFDLTESVSEWDREEFERWWRVQKVEVEWLRSPRGRLDRAIDADPAEIIVTSSVDNSTD